MTYLSIEETQDFLKKHPILADKLKINQKYAEEGYYAYRITKSGYMHRQPKAHCVNEKWTNYSSCYENAKRAKERRCQRRLLEIDK